MSGDRRDGFERLRARRTWPARASIRTHRHGVRVQLVHCRFVARLMSGVRIVLVPLRGHASAGWPALVMEPLRAVSLGAFGEPRAKDRRVEISASTPWRVVERNTSFVTVAVGGVQPKARVSSAHTSRPAGDRERRTRAAEPRAVVQGQVMTMATRQVVMPSLRFAASDAPLRTVPALSPAAVPFGARLIAAAIEHPVSTSALVQRLALPTARTVGDFVSGTHAVQAVGPTRVERVFARAVRPVVRPGLSPSSDMLGSSVPPASVASIETAPAPSSLVDALYVRAEQSVPLDAVTLRTWPQPSSVRPAASTQFLGASTPWHSAEQPASQGAGVHSRLSRAEIDMLANKVLGLIRRKERLERESKGIV